MSEDLFKVECPVCKTSRHVVIADDCYTYDMSLWSVKCHKCFRTSFHSNLASAIEDFKTLKRRQAMNDKEMRQEKIDDIIWEGSGRGYRLAVMRSSLKEIIDRAHDCTSEKDRPMLMKAHTDAQKAVEICAIISDSVDESTVESLDAESYCWRMIHAFDTRPFDVLYARFFAEMTFKCVYHLLAETRPVPYYDRQLGR